MKLFQIEEPDGAPIDSDAPGAAVGIDLRGEVAISVGGNAELLPAPEGEQHSRDLGALLLALRTRAEKQLARPVTHAVIAADGADARALAEAAAAAGIELLGLMARAEAAALAGGGAPVLGAAIRAEDLAPAADG